MLKVDKKLNIRVLWWWGSLAFYSSAVLYRFDNIACDVMYLWCWYHVLNWVKFSGLTTD